MDRRWLRVLIAAAALAALSCRQDYALIGWTDPDLGIAARLIQLEPAVVDFGHVEKSRSAAQDVTIRNIGTSDLYILETWVEGYPTFSAQAPGVDKLAPGETTTVRITYNPAGFERAVASLVVRSNDPILPEVTSGLAGRCSPPQLRISPPAFDFGQQFVGCPLSHELELENVGEGDLLISQLGLSDANPEFRVGFADPIPLPISLAPGARQAVVLDYRPSDAGSDEIAVVVGSNDPDRPVAEAPTYGQGRLEGHVTDHFEQVANNRTDILFVVDNSFSMVEEQATLACNFQSFLDVMDTLEIDYQIGVITTDSPVLQGDEKVITPASLTPTETFAINSQVGTGGQGREQGLEMARQALSYPLSASQNEGFLRPKAGLRLIFVSDENDQSPNTVQTYVDFFRNLKAGAGDVIISAIVGDPREGCGFEDSGAPTPSPAPLSQAAEPRVSVGATCPQRECGRAIGGDRYVDARDMTGGTFRSICSCNFIEALENIAYETVFLLDTFLLSQDPIPETLEVYVDEVARDGWRYDEDLNAVVFEEQIAVPANGARLRVEYDLRAYCQD